MLVAMIIVAVQKWERIRFYRTELSSKHLAILPTHEKWESVSSGRKVTLGFVEVVLGQDIEKIALVGQGGVDILLRNMKVSISYAHSNQYYVQHSSQPVIDFVDMLLSYDHNVKMVNAKPKGFFELMLMQKEAYEEYKLLIHGKQSFLLTDKGLINFQCDRVKGFLCCGGPESKIVYAYVWPNDERFNNVIFFEPIGDAVIDLSEAKDIIASLSYLSNPLDDPEKARQKMEKDIAALKL
jgi:hypothetical protein